MKKLLFSLLMALPVIFLAACHNDDDLPDVTLHTAYSGGVAADGSIYVVQGDTLVVDSVWVTPNNGTKECTILAVSYRLDGWLVANVPFVPFTCEIPTASLDPGTYTFSFEAPVVQVDKTPATCFAMRNIKVVADESEIPSTGTDTEVVEHRLSDK